MTAYDKLERVYTDNPREEPLENYVRWHLKHGFVFSTPDAFVMGRAVNKDAPKAEILGLAHLFPREECNAWYLFAASGDMGKMWKFLPFSLGWVCWTRIRDPQSELVFVETERLTRLCPPDLSGFK
jgi:hypothetical protein